MGESQGYLLKKQRTTSAPAAVEAFIKSAMYFSDLEDFEEGTDTRMKDMEGGGRGCGWRRGQKPGLDTGLKAPLE